MLTNNPLNIAVNGQPFLRVSLPMGVPAIHATVT